MKHLLCRLFGHRWIVGTKTLEPDLAVLRCICFRCRKTETRRFRGARAHRMWWDAQILPKRPTRG